MNFSMARMMAVMAFVCVVLSSAFAMPTIVGWAILTFISTVILPPLIWIGALNLNGKAQAFFIGAILGGIPHFVVSSYFLVALAIEFDLNTYLSSSDGELFWVNIVHLLGYVTGFSSGMGGVFAHWLLVPASSVAATELQGNVASSAEKSASREAWSSREHDSPAIPNLPK